jgi:hypothetical protein
MKHKHADLIHAWADGAEIQLYNGCVGEWQDMPNPAWSTDFQYRIKPLEEKKPVVRWLWSYPVGGGWAISDFLTEEDVGCGYDHWVKLEWSRTEFPE